MRELLFFGILTFMCFVAVKDPFKGLLCYTGINVVRPELFFWGGDNGAVAFKVLFLATVTGFLSRKQSHFKAAGCYDVWCIFWFYLAILLSIWLSDWPPHPKAYFYATEMLKLFIYTWIIVCLVEDQAAVKKFQNLVLYGFTFLAIWGWDQHFRGNSRLERLGGDAFPDCNGLAALFVLILPLAFSKLLSSKETKGKIFALVSISAIAMAIVFTQSRGGFLGLAVCMVLCFLHSPRKSRFLTAVLLLFLLVSPFIEPEYVDRISGIGEDDLAEKDGSAGSRLVLWQAATLMFKDKPLFGHGFMTFTRAKEPYKTQLEGKFPEKLLDYSFEPYKVCHGTYFSILAEGGLFLAAPYFLLIGGFLWKFYTNRSRIVRLCADRESVLTLEGIAIGIMANCVSILTIDNQLDIFLPIQLICGGVLLRILLHEAAQPEAAPAVYKGAV